MSHSHCICNSWHNDKLGGVRWTLITDFTSKVRYCICKLVLVQWYILIMSYCIRLCVHYVFAGVLSSPCRCPMCWTLFPDLFVAVEMGVTPRPLLLVCTYLAAALIGGTHSEGVCLQDGKHKATPGPEPHLRECALYADSEWLCVCLQTLQA